MENAYGIGVKNRYELFYDEDVDPLEIIRQQEAEKEKRKTDKTHSKDKSKISKSGKLVATGIQKKSKENAVLFFPKPTESSETSSKTRPRPFNDRNLKNNRNLDDTKDIEERKNLRNREENQSLNFEIRERDGDNKRGRGGAGGFRGRGRPRGRGGSFNNFDSRPPRRDFDRHSGSDKSTFRPVEKRDGAGSNTWGETKDLSNRRRESDSWMDEENDSIAAKTNDTWQDSLPINESFSMGKEDGTPVKSVEDTTIESMESKENEPASEERTIDENVREMTLDEWKREQEAKKVKPKYNLRKPGEGEDGNQWKKLYMLKKKVKEDEDDEDEDEEYDVDEDDLARRGRQRQLVDIQINFNDSRRGRGRGRGVRSGIGPRSAGMMASKEIHREERKEMGIGVGNRGFGRGSMKLNKSGHQSAPRVDDWNDFPSLVTA